MKTEITKAVKTLREGGIIAYPTEGVFGLGCDPFNETAVLRLLKIKKRNPKKGLILIASSWSQAKNLVKTNLLKCDVIKQKSKEPITWVFPATKKAPVWISGGFDTVAIRATLHPIAKEICQKFGGPIISTSANLEGKPPAKNSKEVRKRFVSVVDFIVPGKVGGLGKTTQIIDIKTKKTFRK